MTDQETQTTLPEQRWLAVPDVNEMSEPLTRAAQVLDVMELLLTAASVDTQVDIAQAVTRLYPNGTGSFERLRDDLNELTAQYELEEEN